MQRSFQVEKVVCRDERLSGLLRKLFEEKLSDEIIRAFAKEREAEGLSVEMSLRFGL